MSKYYGSKSEIDAVFIKRKPTVIENEVVVANLERTMSLMRKRIEKLKASRGIFGSNGLDADANDFFSFKPPLYPERPGQIEFDVRDPPPGEGEAIVNATVQGTSSSVGGEGDKGTETNQKPE